MVAIEANMDARLFAQRQVRDLDDDTNRSIEAREPQGWLACMLHERTGDQALLALPRAQG